MVLQNHSWDIYRLYPSFYTWCTSRAPLLRTLDTETSRLAHQALSVSCTKCIVVTESAGQAGWNSYKATTVPRL